jgi:hypothetical protein
MGLVASILRGDAVPNALTLARAGRSWTRPFHSMVESKTPILSIVI